MCIRDSIKGDYDTRMRYYQAIETAQTSNNKEEFLLFIAQVEKECLERYLSCLLYTSRCV